MGIEKGKNVMKNSDIIIFMFDANNLLNLNILIESKKWLDTTVKILVYVNKPNNEKGYYGSIVAGSVVKRIAESIK
jgi:tRNA U34 5-carboxymethylaminomethyl modifying GTPase MnmE/TrmE